MGAARRAQLRLPKMDAGKKMTNLRLSNCRFTLTMLTQLFTTGQSCNGDKWPKRGENIGVQPRTSLPLPRFHRL